METLRLLTFILFISVVLTACADSSTDSDTGEDQQDEQAEPSASINNPGDGAMLEGEITLSIEGEAQEGFDEARIYVGDELIETVSNPTLPYEQTIATYEYDNGDYDLKAELDVADLDTTISVGISVTLENYMVELETDNFFKELQDENDQAFLFIADPEGNVLRMVDASQHSDGVLKLLPPEALENGAPESYSFTVGTVRSDGPDWETFYLNTNIELEPWTRIYRSGSISKEPGPQKELTVELTNFNHYDQSPSYTVFYTAEYIDADNVFYSYDVFDHPDQNTLTATFEAAESSGDLVMTHTPDPNSGTNPTPLYRWEDDLKSLSGTVSYDVAQDFNPMVAHPVGMSSSIELTEYAYFMTVAPNSFDKADVDFAWWPIGNVLDANSNNSDFDIWVPEITERSFITYFAGSDKNDSNITYRYQTAIGEFPDLFPKLDAGAEITNTSLDNMQFSVTGTMDNFWVTATESSNSHYNRWRVFLPPSADSFVFPKIADSLGQAVGNYNRANFEPTEVAMNDNGAYSDYSDYLEDWFGTTDFGYTGEFIQTIKTLPSSQQKKKYRAQPIKPNGVQRSILE